MDPTSGYRQIPIDEESQNLLFISTPLGRYRFTALTQGVCSASDIFKFLTDGSMRYDGSEAIKNMDDILLCGRTIKELKKKLESFLSFWDKKHLKLKPFKMNISEQVEFSGTLISSYIVKNKTGGQSISSRQEDTSILWYEKILEQKRHPSFLRDVGQLTELEPFSSNTPKSSRIKRESGVKWKIRGGVSSCNENYENPDSVESLWPYREAAIGNRQS